LALPLRTSENKIRSEEQVLKRELEGCAAYRETVKYRLIPFLW